VELTRHDYGFTLQASIGDRHVIACQPVSTTGPRLFRTAEQVVALLRVP
jgi:hypothetical protein